MPTTAGRALAVDFDFRLDAFGRELLHVGGVFLEDVVGILIGHQAHGDLGRGLGGNHGLGAGGDEASGHAVDFERGARPGAVEDRVAGFSGEDFGADFGLAVVLFVEGQTLPGFEFVLGRSLDAFVEAGDQDFALGVFQLADDLDQGEERIRGSASVHAGVQVGLGAVGFDFGVDQTAQADAQRGKIGREEFGVADQREISFQLGFLLDDVFVDGFAADFFFAFENHFHVDRQLAAAGLHEGFESFDFHPELAFVVDGAAGVDVVVALGGLEGRRVPFVERLGGLHVVVGVAQRGRLAGGVQPVGVDEGMSLGGDDLDVFHADAAQFVGHVVGSFLNVGLVLFEGADAGDAEKIFEFVQKTLLITAGKIDCGRGHR